MTDLVEGEGLGQLAPPNSLRSDTLEQGRLHIRADHEGPCWHCGALTPWIEVCFEAWLCPGDCSQAKYDEFWEHLETLPPLDMDDPFGTGEG